MAERKIQLTSSGNIGDPEQTCFLGGEVSKEWLPEDAATLEIYPTAHRLLLDQLPVSEATAIRLPLLNKLVKAGYGYAFHDGRVTSKKLHEWEAKYNVKIDRFHMPFHYSIPTASYNYLFHSVFVEPGTLKDRAIASAMGLMTMTAMNNFATRLAGEFDAGLNMHRYVAEQAAKRGKLAKVVGKARYVQIENDLDYTRKNPEHIKKERDVQKALDVIVENDLDGLIYGVDHAYRAGVDPREDFERYEGEFKEHLRTIHLSGSKGDHGLILPDDTEFWDMMKFVSQRIPDNVTFCIDVDPTEMYRLTQAEQVDYMKETVKELRRY